MHCTSSPPQLSARSGHIHDSWGARPRWRTIDFVSHSKPGHSLLRLQQ